MFLRAKKRLHFFFTLRNVWFCKRRVTALTDVMLIRRLKLQREWLEKELKAIKLNLTNFSPRSFCSWVLLGSFMDTVPKEGSFTGRS